MGIGFTSSSLPFYGRFTDFRTSICFVQGGLFLTAIGMQFYCNAMGHFSESAKVWTPMGMATVGASLNATIWAIAILVSADKEKTAFINVCAWNAVYIWITIFTAHAQIVTREDLDFWVLLFGRIGSWFLLCGLFAEIGSSGFSYLTEELAMSGWLWVYVAFVLKMLGFVFWACSILATLREKGAKCLSDERGGLPKGEKYDEAPFI